MKEKISEISPLQTNTITISNQPINLYVEFIDYLSALDSFKSMYKYELDFIKEHLDLEELSIENGSNIIKI